MRLATIDIGTNSVLLLVAEATSHGVRALAERATITRLGEGVDKTGTLAPRAAERTLACLRSYADEARALGVTRVLAVGTSALRDAAGAPAFIEEATLILGDAPRVISGLDEARLTFAGALSGLALRGHAAVVDIGGGSTEIVAGVIGTGPAEIMRAASLDVGSVRLTERHVRSDPPREAEREAIRDDVRRALASVEPLAPGVPLVAVAGTATTVAAVALGMHSYNGARVHGAELSAEQVRDVVNRLALLPLAERKAVPGLTPDRADVIVAGAELLSALLSWYGADALWISDRGVRWGLALATFSSGEFAQNVILL